MMFVCAAVGLTVSPDPIGALQPTIAAAMIIGLFQQARQLRSARSIDSDSLDGFTLAQTLAITWRVALAAALACCLTLGFAFDHGMLAHPKRDDVWLWDDALGYVFSVSIVLVLFSSHARWQSAPTSASRSWRAWRWGVALLVAVIIVANTASTVFLVHRATANIEAAIPPRFQRPDVYPHLADEWYHTFWLASAACLALLTATVLLVRSSHQQLRGLRLVRPYLLAAGFLATAGGYCIWYYTTEHVRLSPELATAGLAAEWWDWAIGALFAVVLVTAVAYRLSTTSDAKVRITDDLSRDLDRHSFHELMPWLMLFVISAVAMLIMSLLGLFGTVHELSIQNISLGLAVESWLLLTTICDPMILLTVIAPTILSIQIIRLRYLRRQQPTAWEISPVLLSEFTRNWVASALLLLVAVPTLNAFAFVFWLGPFNYVWP
jgi:hypothetical protein